MGKEIYTDLANMVWKRKGKIAFPVNEIYGHTKAINLNSRFPGNKIKVLNFEVVE